MQAESKQHHKKHGFTGQIGFVMAAAGSAVGVGNLWRFPYLAAKDGGGLFILIYLILTFTFGFTLLTSDIAIGRRTGKNSIKAYAEMSPKWSFLGIITFLVPVLIMTYYAVIGGWITRYIVVYLTGQGGAAATDSFFTDFITSPSQSTLYATIFMLLTAWIVFNGVEKGIEKYSKILMPVMLVMIVAIAIFALTLTHTDDAGVTRTGLQGLAVYLTPNFEGLTVKRFLQILLDAMSQIFFSLSVSMGIMITYGSYIKKDVDVNASIHQIEFFDTGVALLAGMMIIPSIFVFEGVEGMKAGPSLMFISLPKVFASMPLPDGGLCGADQLRLCPGDHHGQLYGDLPHQAPPHYHCPDPDLHRRLGCHRAGLQQVLRGDPAAQRKRRPAAGSDGLHQQ